MFLRAASLSTKTKQHKLDRLRPPSPWTNDLADEGVAIFVVQASNFTNICQMKTKATSGNCLITIDNYFFAFL